MEGGRAAHVCVDECQTALHVLAKQLASLPRTTPPKKKEAFAIRCCTAFIADAGRQLSVVRFHDELPPHAAKRCENSCQN